MNWLPIFKKNYTLDNRISHQDKRYATFKKAFSLMEERNAIILVETGTARYGKKKFEGDGGSTILFSDWISRNKNGAHLYSVDINKNNLKKAKRAVKRNVVTFFNQDSIHFLKQFSKTIDFLYLDSLDFDPANPELSQYHHLKEIEAAYDKMKDESIVMIDDCALPHGGKGKLAINFLSNQGWKKITDSYQVILIR